MKKYCAMYLSNNNIKFYALKNQGFWKLNYCMMSKLVIKNEIMKCRLTDILFVKTAKAFVMSRKNLNIQVMIASYI